MSAKILQALSDENPELKRQIGCMTGIFQLFDRSHVISSKRINAPKRLPPGHSATISLNSGAEALTSSPRPSLEKIGGRYVSEQERTSVESSTTSVSSTSFSSFSSLEYPKAAQSEAPISTPSRASNFQSTEEYSNAKNNPGLHYQSSATTLPSKQFHGVREVTDSTHREPHGHGLSVKTKIKDDYISPVFKDSPRPLQLSRSLDGGAGGTRKPKVPLDLNESLRVLAKLKEGPWHSTEARAPARASSEVKRASYAAKEFPRISYDGRELSRSSFDSRETSKMSSRFQELPRLSLDSRQTSVRSSNSDSYSNAISKGFHSDNYRDVATCNRSSSVVAKLMGLDPLLGSNQIDEKQIGASTYSSGLGSYISERNGNMSPGNLRKSETPKLERCASSPKCTVIDNPSPKATNSYPVLKQNLPPKFPIETAPWKQQRESGATAKKPSTKYSEVTPRQPTSPSVYSEIEKRLNDLDFKQSHKDLRALKQIIEAMQAKRQNADKKEEQEAGTYATFQRTNVITSENKNSKSLPTKGLGSPRAPESPIIVIKPAKPAQKSGSFSSSLIPLGGLPGVYKSKSMDSSDTQTSYNNERLEKNKETRLHLRNPRGTNPSTEEKTISKMEEARSPRLKMKSTQSSSPRNQIPLKEKTAKGPNTSSSSPRLPQRKVEVERRSRSPVPSPELNKPTKRQPGRQIDMGSPGARRGVRSVQSDDQSSERSSDTRHFNRGGDEMSVISDSSGSFLSQVDAEVTSTDTSVDLIASLHHKSSFSSSGRDGIGFVAVPEQPSPISVLDASFYQDDDFTPSPVKYSSNAFRDRCILEESFAENALDVNIDISKKESQKVQLLALKLRQLNSGHTGAFTDHIAAPLCNETNPDHQYISEILNASGILLKDFKSVHAGPVQVHSTGHVINPELFLVLEQVKASSMTETSTHEDSFVKKQRRKLVFDALNEVLVRKLSLANQAEPWLLFRNLKGYISDGQLLLKEVCLEFDQLCPRKLECDSDKEDVDWLENMLAVDVTHRDEIWTHLDKEIPHLVLDVERLIFKDLIDEIVSKEASTMRDKPGIRRRKLFTK